MTTARGFVEPLGSGADAAADLGGKGATLSRLVSLGYRVPPGFTLTVAAYDAALSSLGLRGHVEALADALVGAGPTGASRAEEVEPAALLLGASVHRSFIEGRVPEEIMAEVLDQVRQMRLENGGSGLIVRSSATAEDSSAHSFAGIFDSIAIDDLDSLESAILRVWASALSPRALGYARERGLPVIPRMAVVVQRFVDAERSGVMFTRFERPGLGPNILIEHVSGGCDKLVKGEVTPERLWISRADDAGGNGTTVGRASPSTEPSHAPNDRIDSAHVRELARLAGALERSLGGPQDVEWCIQEGEVHVLQSRPVTASQGAGSRGPPRGPAT